MPLLICLLVLMLAVVAAIVFIERAQRRLLIQYPKRQVGNQRAAGRGLASAAEAQHVRRHPADLRLVAAAAAGDGGAVPDRPGPNGCRRWSSMLGRGQPLYLLIYVALIMFFAFFYTSVVFNPTETADNLRKYGGFIPGIRPGEKTAQFIDYVLTRITVVGAIYLAIVCVLPELLISYAAVPFYFGGTSLLIAVSVTMDTVAQIQSHLIAQQYEGPDQEGEAEGPPLTGRMSGGAAVSMVDRESAT